MLSKILTHNKSSKILPIVVIELSIGAVITWQFLEGIRERTLDMLH